MNNIPLLDTSSWRSAPHPGAVVPKPLAPRRRASPEQELMLAVLRQALDDYGRTLTASHSHARRACYALERWFFGNDLTWPFSFVNVCEGVGIDAGALRAELRRWRANRASHVQLVRAVAQPFRLPNRAMRGSRTRVGATA